MHDRLNQEGIFPRRYFYPCLDQLPYVARGNNPVARSIAERAMALPLYPELPMETVEKICDVIQEASE